MHRLFNYLFQAPFLLAFFLLAACSTYSIESSIVTRASDSCTTERYLNLVDRNAPNLNSGRDRDHIVRTLSEMAVQIWQERPDNQHVCQVQYGLNYRSHARPVYGVELEFPVTVTILDDRSRVCLNHTDLDGPDRYGVRVADEEIRYPWRWVDQGPSVEGVSEGFFARREYVPVCFDRNGEITEYLNG